MENDSEALMTMCERYPWFSDFDDANAFRMPRPVDLIAWLEGQGMVAIDLNDLADIIEPPVAHTVYFYFDDNNWPGTVVFTDSADAALFKLST
jgi:hypothetical protein